MGLFFETLEERRLFSTLTVGAGEEFATLQAAANSVSAGDTVVVEAGSYAGFEMINRASGTAGLPIVFDFQSGATITDADGDTNDGIDIEHCNFVTVEGATIVNPNGDISRAGIRLDECNNSSILNNNVSGVGAWGIYTGHSSALLIQANTSDDNAAHGIYCANSETNVQILDNTLFGNANCGIHTNGDDSQGGSGIMTDLTIAGNVIFDNGSTGGSAINCDGVQDSLIANNLIYDNLHTGIALFNDDSAAGPAGDVVANNTIVMPGLTGIEVDDPAAANFLLKNIVIGNNTIASNTSESGNLMAASTPSGLFAPGGFQLANPANGLGVGSGLDSDPPTQLVFLEQPTEAAAGQASGTAFIVEFEDASGNVVINNRSRVVLTIQGSTSKKPLALVTDTAGVAAFNGVVIDTAGNLTIQASDGSLTPAVSTSIQVDPGPAVKMVYATPPVNATAGAIGPVVVSLEDQFGNLATNSSADVTLGIASGPAGATLGGTPTVAVSGGQATFSDLQLTEAGKYRLVASEGSLTLASKTILVTPGAASSMNFVSSPADVVAAKPFSSRIKVDVTDGFGNAVANGMAVTLAIESGPAGGVIIGKATGTTRNGLVTFSNATLRTAGDYLFTATAGGASVTSGDFTVSAGPPAHLIFTEAPVSGAAGAGFDVQVELVDKFGNLVTDNSSVVSVTLGTHPRGAALGGTTSADISGGIATFSGLVLDTAGTYTLRFGDGLARVNSGAFSIS